MVAKVFAATLLGLECKQIDVEVDYRHGLSHFAVVGLGDKSVQEAKERIISAIKNSQAEFIPKRVIVNLAPADMPKSGPIFDLAIAAGYLLATAQIEFETTGKVFLGELALDGTVRPIRGVLALADGLQKLGFTQVFLPAANATEASLISGLELFPVESLNQLIAHFHGQPIPKFIATAKTDTSSALSGPDLADVKGLFHAKRALEIVAAGGHNLLLYGVPGAGKTFMARCLPGILPDMTMPEALEVTKIYSVSGLLSADGVVKSRPFRNPHHTSSRIALIGGGPQPLPGEISLASRGILFLDEFPEFSIASLEALRQPLEDKVVHISRASGRVSFPANFMLVAAMNPCRCGNWGDKSLACICTSRERQTYQRRISGPILDRIDIRVKVDKINDVELLSDLQAEPSSTIKLRVQTARELQRLRLTGSTAFTNAEMSEKQVRQNCRLDTAATALARQALQSLGLSARAYNRLLKVSRTIADLGNSEEINQRHLAEALSYRQYAPGGAE